MSRENILIQRPGSPYWYYGEWTGKGYTYTTTKETDYERAKAFKLKSEYAHTVETGTAPVPAPASMTLQEVIDLYVKQADIKPKTLQGNTYSWKKFQALTGVTTLDAACAEGIAKLFKGRADAAAVSPAYQSWILRDMRKLIGYAKAKGMCKDNPFHGVKLPEQEEVYRFITEAEEKSLMNVSSPFLQQLIQAELNMGLRLSQLVSLDWKQYDPQRDIFKIPKQKRGKKREIPLYGPLKGLLGAPKPSGCVFPEFNEMSQEKAEWCIKGLWGRAKKNAGIIGRLRFHDLRHTCASRLAQKLKPQEVRDFFGWSSLAMVDRYVHTTTEEIRRKLEAA